ncbi:LCP family protein [Brachybacterium sp. GCM10030267]|uniref:LCP family protein n=1 Tax=unclassified Brachybacterium TaxID=2623841 RepID=UPI003609218F
MAFWTVLTSILPGAGLLTTRMRRLGWVLLALLALALVSVVAFMQVGDPLRNAMMLITNRGLLIGAMVTVVVVGLVWGLQIVLANLAHSTEQRLAGAKRFVALGLAALMVVAVAVPFGRGVQSLWAYQGLLGSDTVFGGRNGDNPLADGKDPWAGKERVNILLLGQDAGADRTGTRPDTLMVASIDTKTGQTALFSIPRNLESVEFPEGTAAAEVFPDGFDYFGPQQNLINAVWTWAEDRPDLFPDDPNPGLTATTWAVEETLGLETDYYAMVNLQGFEDLVNALGGVEMVVERRIPIGGGAGPISGYIEPGEQELDGYHALWYARSREGSNDFNRMCRQQRIVRAVTEEADPATVAMSIPKLVNATEENIQTDIPVSNLDAFIDLALRVKEGGFTSYPITQDVTPSYDADWDYLEDWVDASIEDSMKQDPPESVIGETEPGSDEPAETGAPPEGEPGTDEGDSPAEETPSQEETTEAEPTDESSTPSEGSGDSSQKAPEIEQDPLKSCLPGAEQG